MLDQPTIEVTDVRMAYRLARNRAGTAKEHMIHMLKRQVVYDELWALDGVTFDLRHGETLGVIGPNGAGKTTIIRMITATSPLTSGELSVAGIDVTRAPREVKSILGVVPQEDNLDPDLPVRKNLEVYARSFGLSKAAVRQRIEEALELFQLDDRQDSNVDDLSGGMKRRLTIARALVSDPQILILDEPTTGLDPANSRRIGQLILALRKRLGATSVVVTHDLEICFTVSDRIVLLKDGEFVAEGTPDEIRASSHPDVREFLEGGAEPLDDGGRSWSSEEESASE